MRKNKLANLLLIFVILLLVLTGCKKADKSIQNDNNDNSTNIQNDNENNSNDQNDSSNINNPKVQIEMEDGGIIVLELYLEYAPETVNNFVSLVKDGFYDGLTFHRIVDGFMAQGGASDNPPDAIKGEFSENGFKQNTLKHTKGIISMARTNNNDSANSQFFIMLGDSPHLDGKYAAFGEVIEGMDVVENFQTVERTLNSMGELAAPVTPVVMKKVTLLEE